MRVEIRSYQECDRAAVAGLWQEVFGYSEARNDPQRVIEEKLRRDAVLSGCCRPARSSSVRSANSAISIPMSSSEEIHSRIVEIMQRGSRFLPEELLGPYPETAEVDQVEGTIRW